MFFPSVDFQGVRMRDAELAEEMTRQGWSAVCLSARLSLSARLDAIRRFKPQIIVLKSARSPLQRTGFYPGAKVVFDIDDADHQDEALVDQITEIAKTADRILCGSRYLAEWYRQHNDNVDVVWTGMQMRDGATTPQANRGPVIGWAHSHPAGYPREAAFTLDVMTALSRAVPEARLRIYGWDDRDERLSALAEDAASRGIPLETRPFMSPDAFHASLQELAVGLQIIAPDVPYSQGKSFGKILNYINADVPVVATDALEHPHFFNSGTDGVLAPHDAGQWAEAIAPLLTDPAQREAMAAAAKEKMRLTLSLPVIAQQVGKIFDEMLMRG